MDPTVVKALQRAATAFAVTFVLGSGVVFAVESADRSDPPRPSVPSPTASPGAGGEPGGAVATPKAYLVWMPTGLPPNVGAELTTVPRVRRVAVATAGVGWLTGSADDDGDPVDAPQPPYMVPLEVTGVTQREFSAFLPRGPERELVRRLHQDQAILSSSGAKLRRLGEGAKLEFAGGVELDVAGVLPDTLMGGYEVLVPWATAADLDAGDPRYALVAMEKGAAPSVANVRKQIVELIEPAIREPAVEVRRPGTTELLRAFDRSLTAAQLKRRFGEFTAYPDLASTTLVFDERWVRRFIEERELPRLGFVTCHRKMLFLLRQAIQDVAIDASLGDIGPCWDQTWRPDGPQGVLPPALWGASIRISVALNRPGLPPLLDARIIETMRAWGFRWAGNDAYPDGSLFEYLDPPRRRDVATPSPTD